MRSHEKHRDIRLMIASAFAKQINGSLQPTLNQLTHDQH